VICDFQSIDCVSAINYKSPIANLAE
jgi:hypothetical protein